MTDKVKVQTTRPVLFNGTAITRFETTEQHRRELATKGLLLGGGEQKAAKNPNDVVTGNAADVIAALEGVNDAALLRAALSAEKAGKDRKTVVDALEAAIAKG